MFRELYDSPWLVTFAVGVISVVGLGLWLRRGSFLTAFLVLFTIEILGDALRSGSWSPLRLFPPEVEDPIGLIFVLLGDFRYFLLIERFAWRPQAKPREATAPPAVLTSILVMCIVPLSVLFLQHFVSPKFNQGQPMYMAWEALFVVLATLFRVVILPRRLSPAPPSVRKWLFEVTDFELLQYALWLIADIIIVTGHSWGFALRIVPNFLYYGFFLLFVAYRAPSEVT